MYVCMYVCTYMYVCMYVCMYGMYTCLSVCLYACTVCMHICDRAYEDQPCKRKLHQVIFSAISSALNVVSHFRKFKKKAH